MQGVALREDAQLSSDSAEDFEQRLQNDQSEPTDNLDRVNVNTSHVPSPVDSVVLAFSQNG
jgi:hypothetical protein